MKKINYILLFTVMIILFSGCWRVDYHKNPRLFIDLPNLVQWGMTEQEVESVLGKPDKIVRGEKKVEVVYRSYNDYEGFFDSAPLKYQESVKTKRETNNHDSDGNSVMIYKHFKGLPSIGFFFTDNRLDWFMFRYVDLKKSEYYLFDEFEKKYGKFI